MKFKSHQEVVPIKAKAAIEIIRKYCPMLSGYSEHYLNILLNQAVKRGDVEAVKFPSGRINIYNNSSVAAFARKLKNNKSDKLPEQLELPVQKEQEKKELYFTITVNNNFQN